MEQPQPQQPPQPWLDRNYDSVIRGLGPLGTSLNNALNFGGGWLKYMSPAADMVDMADGSKRTWEGIKAGSLKDTLLGSGYMAAALAGTVLPGNVGLVDDATDALKRGADDVVDGGRKGIVAYHGSPHDFDKFDLSHIGKGEGAQAYGHGLYFAEKEGVARSYRDAISKSETEWARRALDKAGGDVDEAIRSLTERMAKYRSGGADHYADAMEETLRGLNRFKETGRWTDGRMYQVRINADPNDFLDWDKAIRDQKAKDVLQGIYPTGLDGGSVYQMMMHDARNTAIARGENAATTLPAIQANASDGLRSLGIPGIKYLDQGSRAAGDGSRNFVVFDDSLIEILRKYGILAPIVGGAALGGGLLSNMETNNGT